MIRKVYKVEAVSRDGELKFRRYFSNKKLADRVCRKINRDTAQFEEHKAQDVTDVFWQGFIKEEWVEKA